MTWPFSRIRTYAPGSEVVSDDLNKWQDEMIARHSARPIQIPISLGRPVVDAGPWTFQGYRWKSNANDTLWVPFIGLERGAVVTQIDLLYATGGSASADMDLQVNDGDTLGHRTLSGTTGARALEQWDISDQTIVAMATSGATANFLMGVLITASTTPNDYFYGLEVWRYVPAGS